MTENQLKKHLRNFNLSKIQLSKNPKNQSTARGEINSEWDNQTRDTQRFWCSGGRNGKEDFDRHKKIMNSLKNSLLVQEVVSIE